MSAIKSIRPFIGSKNFTESRQFYTQMGFTEVVLFHNLSYFSIEEGFGFYLQDAYVEDWVNNTMLFLEVQQIQTFYEQLVQRNLQALFSGVRISPIKQEAWGQQFFLHDPSGILWHVGVFM